MTWGPHMVMEILVTTGSGNRFVWWHQSITWINFDICSSIACICICYMGSRNRTGDDVAIGKYPGVGFEFPAQRPVTRSFDVFFDLAWMNRWVNIRGAGDLGRHSARYDVTVMGRLVFKSNAENDKTATMVLWMQQFKLSREAHRIRQCAFYVDNHDDTACMLQWALSTASDSVIIYMSRSIYAYIQGDNYIDINSYNYTYSLNICLYFLWKGSDYTYLNENTFKTCLAPAFCSVFSFLKC